jgi:hypothetical protein
MDMPNHGLRLPGLPNLLRMHFAGSFQGRPCERHIREDRERPGPGRFHDAGLFQGTLIGSQTRPRQSQGDKAPTGTSRQFGDSRGLVDTRSQTAHPDCARAESLLVSLRFRKATVANGRRRGESSPHNRRCHRTSRCRCMPHWLPDKIRRRSVPEMQPESE